MSEPVTLLPPAVDYVVYPNALDAEGAATLLERATGTAWTSEQAQLIDDMLVLVMRTLGAIGVPAVLDMPEGIGQIGKLAAPLVDFVDGAVSFGANASDVERMLDTLLAAGLVSYSFRDGAHWMTLSWPRPWGAGNGLRYRQRAERVFAEMRE